MEEEGRRAGEQSEGTLEKKEKVEKKKKEEEKKEVKAKAQGSANKSNIVYSLLSIRYTRSLLNRG